MGGGPESRAQRPAGSAAAGEPWAALSVPPEAPPRGAMGGTQRPAGNAGARAEVPPAGRPDTWAGQAPGRGDRDCQRRESQRGRAVLKSHGLGGRSDTRVQFC